MHEALAQYIQAVNTWDFDQVSNCLHQNAVFYFSNKTCTGTEQIRAYFENSWATIKDERYWPTDITYLHEDANTLLCIYQFNYSGYIKDGTFVEGFGRATNMFAKHSVTGKWELVHEHLSRTP